MPMLLLVSASVAIDQVIKWLVETRLPFHELVPVIPMFALYRTWNEGIAFSVYGHVVDYILFHTETWSFAVFNLADAFISIGAGLIVLDELIVMLHERKSRT